MTRALRVIRARALLARPPPPPSVRVSSIAIQNRSILCPRESHRGRNSEPDMMRKPRNSRPPPGPAAKVESPRPRIIPTKPFSPLSRVHRNFKSPPRSGSLPPLPVATRPIREESRRESTSSLAIILASWYFPRARLVNGPAGAFRAALF